MGRYTGISIVSFPFCGLGRPRAWVIASRCHRDAEGGFDADMYELQKDFLLGFLAPFLTEAKCPLVAIRNPRPQDDDIPEELIFKPHPPARS
jgi:hypothetical protein